MTELDADTQRALARIARDLADAPVQPSIDERRELMRRMAQDYGPALAPVARIENRTIPGPRGEIPLRLYWPAAPAPGRPLLVHIHGGGWAIGDPDAYGRICRALCGTGGCIVVDVHYRRAPEHKYPAALEDCEAALAWAAENARALGADPAHISVAGDSAGGNLAAALCQRTHVPLALQILLYPVMSARADASFASRRAFGDGRYFLRETDIKNAEREYLNDPRDGDEPGASPLLAPLAQLTHLPPTLIITAAFDPLRDEGEAYADRLRAAGVTTEYICVPATIHAFVLFAGLIPQGREMLTRMGAAIGAAAGGFPAEGVAKT